MFITDTLLTTLMCTPRSVYSWDIVITRAGGRLFFDKRDGSSLDLLTVAETSPEQIAEDKDNINGVQQLSLEATTLNQNFTQQVQRCAVSQPHSRITMPELLSCLHVSKWVSLRLCDRLRSCWGWLGDCVPEQILRAGLIAKRRKGRI